MLIQAYSAFLTFDDKAFNFVVDTNNPAHTNGYTITINMWINNNQMFVRTLTLNVNVGSASPCFTATLTKDNAATYAIVRY